VLWAERALKSDDVLVWLQKAIQQHGARENLQGDNGSEFIAKQVQAWVKAQQIKPIYIEPGSPWQSGFVESFHGRFRDEYLNREQLWPLPEARVVVGDYRREYNQERPHSRLGYESPAGFGARRGPFPAPVGLRLQPMLGLTLHWSIRLSPVSHAAAKATKTFPRINLRSVALPFNCISADFP